MVPPILCGSFSHESDDEDMFSCPFSEPSTPRKTTRRSSFCRRCNKDSKNPYSARGLDKFSALLSDLEEKRQKIYSQKGAQDISFVRFAFSNSNHCTPIVVKLRDRKPDHNTADNTNKAADTKEQISEGVEVSKDVKEEKDKKLKRKKSFAYDNWRRPYYYLPTVMILILVFLAVFGRSVTILCTSLGWYLIPTIQARSLNDSKNQTRKKKEYVRKQSANKSGGLSLAASFKNGNTAGAGGLKDKQSTGEHGHRGLSLATSFKNGNTAGAGGLKDKQSTGEHGHRGLSLATSFKNGNTAGVGGLKDKQSTGEQGQRGLSSATSFKNGNTAGTGGLKDKHSPGKHGHQKSW